MSATISLPARQKLRQQIQSVELADEIVDAINQYLNRFIPFEGTFSSVNWETVFEYTTTTNTTILMTCSIIGRQNFSNQTAFKRTAFFTNQNNVLNSINLTQTDYTNKNSQDFNFRFQISGPKILIQVRGSSNNTTKWKGSIEVESL